MKCKELATYLTEKIMPQIDVMTLTDLNVLKEIIEILSSDSLANFGKKEFVDEWVMSVLWVKDDLRRILEENNIEPTEENLVKYFPNDPGYEISDKCCEAGNELLQDILWKRLSEEENEDEEEDDDEM